MGIESFSLKHITKLLANTLVPGVNISEDIIYKKVVNSSFNVATGTYTENVVNYETKGIKVKFTKTDVSQTNSQVMPTDLKIIISPISGLSLNDYLDDKVEYQGSNYRIKKVEKQFLGSTDLSYTIWASLL